MFWSENHDAELLREVLAFKPYNDRKGSRESGTIWTSIAATLNESKNFNVSAKSVLRKVANVQPATLQCPLESKYPKRVKP